MSEALHKLIEAVEAGQATTADFGAVADKRMSFAFDAYNGSLDAAKALHDALLPGWDWIKVGTKISVKSPDVTSRAHVFMPTGQSDIIARAWLLAILKAKLSDPRRAVEGETV